MTQKYGQACDSRRVRQGQTASAAFRVNSHVIARKPKLEVNPNRKAAKCQFMDPSW
jgi:hypothetical protein